MVLEAVKNLGTMDDWYGIYVLHEILFMCHTHIRAEHSCTAQIGVQKAVYAFAFALQVHTLFFSNLEFTPYLSLKFSVFLAHSIRVHFHNNTSIIHRLLRGCVTCSDPAEI